MRRQFNNVRTYVHDKVQDINQSSRVLSSNVMSSISSLGRKDEKEENRIFGVSLTHHLKITEREISVVIESCVAFLLEFMDEEGLFRIPGSLSEVKRLKMGFETGLCDLTDRVRDPHAVAGTLKSYLRELPDPLLSHSLYSQWIEASQISDLDQRRHELRRVCQALPHEHYVNLRYMVKFLDQLTTHSEVNKMSSQNIAMAITPSLMWAPPVEGEEDATVMHMTATNLHSVVVYSLISHAQFFFPEDVNFTTLATFAANETNRPSLKLPHPDSASTASPHQQPKVTPRKAPKKPAPPVPAVLFTQSGTQNEAEVLCINNNNEKSMSEMGGRKSGCSAPSPIPRHSNSSSHSSTEALSTSSPVPDAFGTGSLDRNVVIRHNSDNVARARKARNRRSAMTLQRPTVPPPERPGSANHSMSMLRQRSVDDLLQSSPVCLADMSRSTEVLNACQQSNSSTGGCKLQDLGDGNGSQVTIESSGSTAGGRWLSFDTDSTTVQMFPQQMRNSRCNESGTCCLKSFRRLNSPVGGNKTQESSETIPFQEKREGQEDKCMSSEAQSQAPKKPPRRRPKSKSTHHHDHHASPEPASTSANSSHDFNDQTAEPAAVLESETTSHGLDGIIDSLNQSIEGLDRQESSEESRCRPREPPAKPPRKSRSREDLADTYDDSGDSSLVRGNEDDSRDGGSDSKVKPPKPAPPPKPKMAIPSATSSYL